MTRLLTSLKNQQAAVGEESLESAQTVAVGDDLAAKKKKMQTYTREFLSSSCTKSSVAVEI